MGKKDCPPPQHKITFCEMEGRSIRKAGLTRIGAGIEFEHGSNPRVASSLDENDDPVELVPLEAPKERYQVWVPHEQRPKDWWWDTPYGPDGNGRHTGPLDDDLHPCLVINHPGFTRERYLADDVQEFIMETKDVGPEDVWVEFAPELYRANDGKTLQLCKSDTSPEERDGLMQKGFTYLGSRCDLMYFIEPEEPSTREAIWGDDKLLTYPGCGVKIRIHRGRCMCSSYHKEPYPGAFDYSQVALAGEFVRPAPVQRQKNAKELAREAREIEEAREARARIEARAAAGDRGAKFLMDLVGIRQVMEEAANQEVLKALQSAHRFQEAYTLDADNANNNSMENVD
jgi:hypothetical protein